MPKHDQWAEFHMHSPDAGSRVWFCRIPGVARVVDLHDDATMPPGHLVVCPTFWAWCLPWRRRTLENRLRFLMPAGIGWTLASWWSTLRRRTS